MPCYEGQEMPRLSAVQSPPRRLVRPWCVHDDMLGLAARPSGSYWQRSFMGARRPPT